APGEVVGVLVDLLLVADTTDLHVRPVGRHTRPAKGQEDETDDCSSDHSDRDRAPELRGGGLLRRRVRCHALWACARASAEDLRGHVRPIIENEYSFIMKPWTRIDQEQSFVFRGSGAEGQRGAQAVDASADPRRRAVVLRAEG